MDIVERMDSLDEESQLVESKKGHFKKGLSVTKAVMMIAGTLAGSGILALPSAVEATGIIGPFIIIFLGALSGYTGAILGWSWTILEQRYIHILNVHTQDPYPLLGEKSLGRPGRIVVKICVYTVTFGGGAVFLLLASDIVSDLVKTLGKSDFSLCYVALIIAAILMPMNWLGTPADFWALGVMALFSTSGACFMVNGYTIYLRMEKIHEVEHPPIVVDKFVLAMGSIAFTLAGHPSFPNIQQDMTDRRKFDRAVLIAFIIVVILYLLITIPSFFLLGNMVGPNILTTLAGIRPGWPVYAAEILLLTHLITAYLVVMSPVNQDLEEIFKVPNKFCLKRVIIRTSVIALILFTAETIPRFGVLLSLVGGSAITMIIYILPVLMYEALCRQKGNWEIIPVPLHLRALHVEILVIGSFILVSSTYFALLEILGPDTFVPPCYVNVTDVHI